MRGRSGLPVSSSIRVWETVRLQTLGMFTREKGEVKFGAALGKTVSQKAQAAHLQ